MALILITMGGVESFEETVTAIRATGARGVGGGSRQFVINHPITADQVVALWQLNTSDRDNPVTVKILGDDIPEPTDDGVHAWWHAENDKPRDASLDQIIERRSSRRSRA